MARGGARVLLGSGPGTYALVFVCRVPATAQIGRLGVLGVRPGAYVYVGSALGPGGLGARVARHLRPGGAVHWHVDYLRPWMSAHEVWAGPGGLRRECAWAQAAAGLPGAEVAMAGFGATDCGCAGHLIAFPALPSARAFRERVALALPDDGPVLALASRDLAGPPGARSVYHS